MKINVLHLSDIHFEKNTDAVLLRATEIAASNYFRAREAELTLITVTGDIAYSGSQEEYKVAETFLTIIREALIEETRKPVYLLMVPGNHDCVLKPKDSVRELIIDNIIKDQEFSKNSDFVEQCVKVQENYFAFRDRMNGPEPIFDSPLWTEYEVILSEKKIRISALNAAWMSRLPENSGTLVYPIGEFNSQLTAPSDFRIALLHQPYNWHQQQSYHQMRTDIRRHATAVLNGHEHIGNAGKIEDDLTGSSLYFESMALQPHEKNAEAGYASYLFDLEARQVYIQRYLIGTTDISTMDDEIILDFPTAAEKSRSSIELRSSWVSDLNNPGANFIHPDKSEILIDDIYVFPDLKDWEHDEPGRVVSISSERVLDRIKNMASALIIGEEKGGKTTLLHVYTKRLFAQGYFPVYVKAAEINNVKSPGDLEVRINRFIEAQYVNHKILYSVPKEKRILLIDDIDRFKSGVSAIPHLLVYAENHFGSVVLTAAQSFEISSLASSSASELLQKFPKYEMLRFGQKLRLRMVKKWCGLGQLTSLAELDKRVHQVESIINTVIGRNLVPQLPIYLLILLQSCDQHQHGEIQNSGFSHYYQFLITKSLGQAGVTAEELNEHYNYLAHLTWFMQEKKVREISKAEFRSFNDGFSNKFSSVDCTERLSILVSARLLSQRGDSYSFAYPYVFYFFLGKYLSIKINKEPEIRQWVEEACSKLYLRENASAILFLTHHDSDPWVIEKIIEVVKGCFSDSEPMHFNGDAETINQLVSNVSDLVLAAPDIDRNQEKSRADADELDVVADQIPDAIPDENGELNFVAKFILLFKTAEILGQILKNYYGSLEKPFKAILLKEVFDGPLRALNLQIQEITSDMDGFVSYIESVAFKDEKKITLDDRKKLARKVAVNFLGWLGTSVVSAAAYYVATDKLRDDVSTLVASNPTIAYRLIDIGTRLVRPGAIPLVEIEKLAKELKDNHFAFQILQALGVNHLYLFHTDVSEKNRLCSMLKISMQNTKVIESAGRDTKLISKR